MADDPVVPTNTLPPIPFNQFTAEDQKTLHPGKTIEETTPVRVLPWSANRGNLSADQIRSSRQRWIDAKLPVEKFDEALIADGGTPPDFETEKLERAHGLQNPDARDVKFENPLAAKHATELAGFVQAARLNAGLGAALMDHIAANAPKISSMSAAEQTAWNLAQDKLGLTLSGGRANWEKVKVDAKAFLDRMKTVDQKSGGDLAANLAKSAFGQGDAFLLTTFATAQQMHNSYAAAAARRKK